MQIGIGCSQDALITVYLGVRPHVRLPLNTRDL